MVTLQECSALFRETGHPASETTLRRWIAAHDVRTEWEERVSHRWVARLNRDIGRRQSVMVVSFTEMLRVHKEEIAKRD
ncbi:hypothetical protein HY68_36710 [Streptomyces sp. AcH 505]|nr:hypothetical protein HY68_36710 [Streptomyces sp. AcH 505]